jgi:2-polyprenyl-3-methyl-5-hydroxy-6-metoxy-1,4-benzoquinol methylase
MDIKELNKKANNSSGVRADFKYGNMLDQMRYMFTLKYSHNKVILDFACGTGWGSYLIAQAGANKVYSVDFSKDAIETAMKYYSHNVIEHYYGDLLENNIADSSIDTITCIETIAHLDNPEKYMDYFYDKIKKMGF